MLEACGWPGWPWQASTALGKLVKLTQTKRAKHAQASRESEVQVRVYCGTSWNTTANGWQVFRNGNLFNRTVVLCNALRQERPQLGNHVWNSSASLAYALLYDVLKSHFAARKWHLQFAREVVQEFSTQWVLLDVQIEDWYRTARPDDTTIAEVPNAEAT